MFECADKKLLFTLAELFLVQSTEISLNTNTRNVYFLHMWSSHSTSSSLDLMNCFIKFFIYSVSNEKDWMVRQMKTNISMRFSRAYIPVRYETCVLSFLGTQGML